jgi:hypothetical protein
MKTLILTDETYAQLVALPGVTALLHREPERLESASAARRSDRFLPPTAPICPERVYDPDQSQSSI